MAAKRDPIENSLERPGGSDVATPIQITSFRLPSDMLWTTALIATVYCFALAPRDNASPLLYLIRLAHSTVGSNSIYYATLMMVLIHVLESLYTLTLCRRHRTGFLVGAIYVITTILFGFPIWRDLRRRVQIAQMESVMKAQ